MNRYQGRKVANPKLVVHADVPQYGGRPGLDGAWESMGKAKVELKKAEYRLSEAEKPTAYDIGLSCMQDSVVTVDRVPRYTVTQHSDATPKLDDFGRTSYMKAKMNATRKVSRMDNKYEEEPEVEVRQPRPRSPLREASNGNHNKQRRQRQSRHKPHTHKQHRLKEYELDLQPVKYGDVSTGSIYWSEGNKQDTGNGPAVNMTYTVPKAKKILKVKAEDFKKDSGRGIEMLKEKILMQKLNMSDTDSGASAGFTEKPAAHTDADIVVPKQYSEYDLPERAQTLTRKVAAGPNAPHYKGFNEAETKYKVNDGTVLKTSELQRYKQQLKKERHLGERKHQDLDLYPVPGPTKQKPSHQKVESQPVKTPKRLSRVVARKSVTTAAATGPAIITTTSWREGEKLLQRELGKAPRARVEGAQDKKPMEAERQEPQKSAQQRPEKASTGTTEVLSATAKAVLEALASSDEEVKEKQSGSKSPPVKRKRPKSVETMPEEKKQKVPLYNRKDVQIYMRKKQSQAKQMEAQKREEEKKREELRRQNLQRLYDKQKESAAKAGTKRRSEHSQERKPQDKLKESGGSDKENQRLAESSDSVTLTEDSEPTPVPAQQTQAKETSGKEERDINDVIHQYIEKDRSKEEERRLREQTTPELIQKYLQSEAQFKKEQTKPEVVAMVTQLTGIRPEEFVSRFAEKVKQSKLGERPPKQDVIPHVGRPERPAPRSAVGASKADRLKNLQMMSSSLSSKLRHTAANIASMPIDKWAAPTVSEDDEYVTRYERIVGSRDKQEIFMGPLPGASGRPSRRTEEQTVSRMYEKRVSSKPEQVEMMETKKSDKAEPRSKSVPSTDDSEMEVEPPSKGLSSHLNRADYCVSGQAAPRSAGHQPTTATVARKQAWAQKPDSLSVFDAYKKKQKRGVEMQEPMMNTAELPSKTASSTVQTRAKTQPTAQQTYDEVTTRSVSYGDDFEVSVVERTERSQVSSNPGRSQVSSMPQRREAEGQEQPHSEDDTVHEESYSQSTPNGKDHVTSVEQTAHTMDDKTTENSLTYSEDSESENHLTKQSENQSGRQMSVSERHSLRSQPTRTTSKEKTRASSVPGAGGVASSYPQPGGRGVARMSPAALEQAMMVELERLEGMEESVKQLTHIDRSRGVSLAQQETVSLAQILKARQELHMSEMASLQQRTAKEKADASRQLDEAQKRASEAAQSAAQIIHQVRTETAQSFEDSTRRLLESQAHAAKTTFEAAKQIAEHMGVPPQSKEARSTQYSRRSVYTTELSQTGQTTSYISDSLDSQSSFTRTRDEKGSLRSVSVRTAEDSSLQKTESIKSEDIQTADDLSKRSAESIETELGVGNGAASPTSSRSIQEDITADDRVYTGRADTSLTEEEMERSLRDVLPSEGERRKLKKSKAAADISSLTDDFSVSNARRLSFDDDSFSKFAAEFYEQYVQQEDMRQKHQEMLLKLREKAVSEKLNSEKAWFSQQKKQLRDKGTDDKYPQLKKKQRGVILRLEQEQVEIMKLQEVSRMQQELLKLQMQDLSKRFPIKQRFLPLRAGKLSASSRRNVSSDSSETELSLQSEDVKSPNKDGKPESELLSESTGPGLSPGDKKVMQKLKKIKMMDEKYLTVRQQQLLLRRKNAEKLLMWRQQLDLEEREIEDMELKAMALWESTKAAGNKHSPVQSHTDSRTTVIETHTKHTEAHDTTEIGTETIATETITTHHGGKTTRSEVTSKSHPVTSSIQEESNLKKSPDTSDDNINNTSVEYSNDTFEDASKSAGTALSLAKVHQPRLKYSHKGSDSESDDSLSLYLSEAASDQSDVEGRIRALQEELKRRKLEVERLKREHKKNRRDKLKQKEEQLKTKIEACDSYIQQVQTELQNQRDQDPATVKPQIKKPQATSKAPDDKSNASGSPELKGKLVSLADRKSAAGKPDARTESVDSYTEDITEDLPSYTDTFHKSEGKLKLELTEKEETKQEKEDKPDERAVDTARSVTEIPEEASVITAPVSEAPSERSHRARSSESGDKPKPRLHSVKSYSETEDYSDHSDKSYTSRSYTDYTDTSTVSKTDRKSRPASEKKEASAVHTDEEISEQLSVPSVVETEEKSDQEEDAPGLTFDLSAPTPVDETNHRELELSQEVLDDVLPELLLGDRVLVAGEHAGTLRYKGTVKFAPGHWVGVELDQSEGSNDGCKDEEEYFSCAENHGLFVPAEKISALSQTENILSMKAEDFLIELSTPQSPPPQGGDEVEGDESMTSLDRAISSAENAVKGFVEESAPAEQQEEAPAQQKQRETSFVEDQVVEDLTQKQSVDKQRVSDIVTENLVNDALDTILDIRKKKGSPPQKPQVISSAPEKESEGSGDEFGEVDIPLINEVTVHTVVEDLPLRPESPDIHPEKQVPEVTDYDFDTDGFWEDIEISPKPLNEPERALSPSVSAEMKLDLQKLSEEVFYAVPNSLEDVTQLVDNTVDVYWEKRRYGETWEDVVIPSDFYASEDQGVDLESRSRKVYKRLLFDLSGEILTEMYAEDESPDTLPPPWEKPLHVKRKYHKGQNPPTVPGEVKPLVSQHVTKYLGLVKDTAGSGESGGRVSKLNGRKKKDNVDQILTSELREEEPDWVNYDADELAVKMQLSDAIFDSLLLETGKIFSAIMPCGAS